MAVDNFPMIYQMETSRNCHSFSLSVQRVPDNDGNIKVGIVRSDISQCQNTFLKEKFQYRLCVVMRKRLLFYYWKDRKFIPLSEVTLTETPRSLAWWDKSICMGTKSEYSLYEVIN